MKKVLLILLSVIAFGCGDKSNKSAGSDTEGNTDGQEQVAEPDSTSYKSDTTSAGNSNQKDSLR
jgi:hypothetical protein